jgi:DNA-binding NtrC family response regulator
MELMPRAGTFEGKEATVLVVDDDEGVRAVAVAALNDRFHVIEAENGTDALELLDREPVDLVVTDVVMPGISGFHVLRGAQSRRPAPKVLVISGGFAPGLAEAQLPPGGFLPKPFRLAELERAVKRLLDS